jgi:DNA-binding CsgD family transcriptional regulator
MEFSPVNKKNRQRSILHPNDVFVGRDRELQELTAGLESSAAGSGRIFMISGEAGIGKTRLARELASRAKQQDVCVLWGRCFEDAGVPSYWPWIEVIRRFLDTHDGDELQQTLGVGAVELARIVPEIRGKVPNLPTVGRRDPAEVRFRLFDSIVAFVQRAAENKPLLLILDSLHCADRSSLRLLEILSQSVDQFPLLVVCSCRNIRPSRDHPLTETLGELSGHAHFQNLELGALNVDEVARFVSSAMEDSLSPEQTESIHRRTDGNPLFVLEVIRILLHAPQLLHDDFEATVWSDLIPHAIRAAISKRLNLLSNSSNRVLIVASVLGPQFGLRELECILREEPAGVVADATDEALSVSLLEESSDSAGRYRFPHALFREAIAARLTPADRNQLHDKIGFALEELYRDDIGNHVIELSHHFSKSGTDAGKKKGIQYLTAAGEAALAIYAIEESVVHFRSALAAIGSRPMDSETASILTGLSRALFRSDPTAEAKSCVTRAFEYYEGKGDATRAADAVDFSFMPHIVSRWSTSAAFVKEMTQRALTLVSPNSLDAGRLLCQYGQCHSIEGNSDSASAIFQQALDISQREGDVSLEARVWSFWAEARKSNLQLVRALEDSSKAINLARAAQDSRTERLMLHVRGFHFVALGNLTNAQMDVNELNKFDAGLRIGWLPFGGYHVQECIYQFAGDWKMARGCIDRALRRHPNDMFTLQNLAILEYELGNLRESDACLAKIVSKVRNTDPRGTYVGSAMECVALARLSHLSDAENRMNLVKSTAESILASPFADPFTAVNARAGLCLIALQRAGIKKATEQDLGDMERLKGSMNPWGSLSFDRLLGLMNQALGRRESAERHYNDAIDFLGNAGYRPELAWTLYDFAGLLLSQNNTAGHEKAKSRLDQALSITQEVGMRTLAKLVSQRLSGAEPLSGELDHKPPFLSKRETEVLRLIAKGKTNREIAYDLFISENTVGNHVGRILAKTKTTNRTEAALFASRNGLVDA